MKRTIGSLILLSLLIITYACDKHKDDVEPENVFCYKKSNQVDSLLLINDLVGEWKVTARSSNFKVDIDNVNEAEEQSYLLVFSDLTFQYVVHGDTLEKSPLDLNIRLNSNWSNLGSIWFCDKNTLITSTAPVDGPVLKYIRVNRL